MLGGLMPQTDEPCGLLQREQWIRFQMVREGLAQTLPRACGGLWLRGHAISLRQDWPVVRGSRSTPEGRGPESCPTCTQ
jgi:hypothetical protein